MRVAVAAALTAIALRMLAGGAAMHAFRRAAGRDASEALDAAAEFFLPWSVYLISLAATTVLARRLSSRSGGGGGGGGRGGGAGEGKYPYIKGFNTSGGGRSSVVGVAHGAVWSVMSVLVMLFGHRGPAW